MKVKQFLFEDVHTMESKTLTLNAVCSMFLISKTINYLKAGCTLGMISPDTHLLLFLTVEVLQAPSVF